MLGGMERSMARRDKNAENQEEIGNLEFGDVKREEEESTGSKIVSILIVIVIILIWLGIFAALIKWDVGGFGSHVLRPILKDVPIVNAILPEESDAQVANDNNYKYKSLSEAIDRIKELELEIDSLKNNSGVNNSYISELEEEVKRLKVFENSQEEFAREKEAFDREVVFADAAPSLEEYQKYYESIDPDNAAEIYRQVIEQVQYDKKVQDEADKYAAMEPAQAAQIIDVMAAGDLDMVCAILGSMKPAKSALILAELDSNVAAKITKQMLSKE